MRSAARCLALLPLLLLILALPAHADPMDNFTITGGGATIDFSLPASTTQPCCGNPEEFIYGTIPGTVNGAPEPIFLNFLIGSGCAECETILLAYPSASWTIYLPYLPSLYGLTFSGTYPNQDMTLTFIPGDYMTDGYNSQFDFAAFEIEINPETAATPEPATLSLSALAAASLVGLLLMKRRVLG